MNYSTLRRVVLLCIFAGLPFAAGARNKTSSDEVLKAGGWIEILEETSSFEEKCSSSRKYFVIHELSNMRAQDRINTSVKKQMTVGRKLNAKDCNGAASYPNGFRFDNLAEVIVNSKAGIAVQFTVSFPGNQNERRWCETYDLKSGKKILPKMASLCPQEDTL